MTKLIKFLLFYVLGILTVIIFQRYNPPTQEERSLGESVKNVRNGLSTDYQKTKQGLAEDIDEATKAVSQGIETTRTKTRSWLSDDDAD